MDHLIRTAANPWGQEVALGISWDLVWLAVIASALFVVGHLLWARVRGGGEADEDAAVTVPAAVPERVVRHGAAARAFHWLMAVAMLALLVTAFVPVLGLEFAWVELHWMAGVLLTATIVWHVVHSVFWQDLRSMWVDAADLREAASSVRRALSPSAAPPPKPGKYPADQKLYHHAAAVAGLTAAATGLVMMVRIDTPFWTRNPYLFGDGTWGVIYVLHGLAGVALIGLVAAHIYFAVRPEERWMLWSMVRGWIRGEDYVRHFDPSRWTAVPGIAEVADEGGEGAPAGAAEGASAADGA